MTINERIEEELKDIKKSETIVYSILNFINIFFIINIINYFIKQIKTISSKTKTIKNKQTSSSLNFECMKEMNFLNLKQ